MHRLVDLIRSHNIQGHEELGTHAESHKGDSDSDNSSGRSSQSSRLPIPLEVAVRSNPEITHGSSKCQFPHRSTPEDATDRTLHPQTEPMKFSKLSFSRCTPHTNNMCRRNMTGRSNTSRRRLSERTRLRRTSKRCQA